MTDKQIEFGSLLVIKVEDAVTQWSPAPFVISSRLRAGRLQLVCQD